MALDRFISGHARFRTGYQKQLEQWLKLAIEGQHPHTLWIGCSDSRVIPEQITGATPGELFVMRNIANVVPPYGTSDIAAAAVIEFAIVSLQVENIVICGHTNCGGVEAALKPGALNRSSYLGRWISWIQPAITASGIQGISEEERYLEVFKANVLLQCQNARSYPEISRALKAGQLTVHGWLFDLASGELIVFDEATKEWQPLLERTETPGEN